MASEPGRTRGTGSRLTRRSFVRAAGMTAAASALGGYSPWAGGSYEFDFSSTRLTTTNQNVTLNDTVTLTGALQTSAVANVTIHGTYTAALWLCVVAFAVSALAVVVIPPARASSAAEPSPAGA